MFKVALRPEAWGNMCLACEDIIEKDIASYMDAIYPSHKAFSLSFSDDTLNISFAKDHVLLGSVGKCLSEADAMYRASFVVNDIRDAVRRVYDIFESKAIEKNQVLLDRVQCELIKQVEHIHYGYAALVAKALHVDIVSYTENEHVV